MSRRKKTRPKIELTSAERAWVAGKRKAKPSLGQQLAEQRGREQNIASQRIDQMRAVRGRKSEVSGGGFETNRKKH